MYNGAFSAFFCIEDYDIFVQKLYQEMKCIPIKCEKKEEIQPFNMKRGNILHFEGYLYKQKNGIIIFQNNLIDGWCNLVRSISLHEGIESLFVQIQNDLKYPGYILNYYSSGKERVISNIKEGKWSFFTKGDLAKFECPEFYTRNKGKKKFDYEIILSYCRQLNLDIEDDECFKSVSEIFYFHRE